MPHPEQVGAGARARSDNPFRRGQPPAQFNASPKETIANTFDIDTVAETFLTATVRENAAPVGATPGRDAFDSREVRDREPAAGARHHIEKPRSRLPSCECVFPWLRWIFSLSATIFSAG